VPVVLPDPRSGSATVEIGLAGRAVGPSGRRAVGPSGRRAVGAIVYDSTLIADAELVRTAGRVVAIAVDHERLTAYEVVGAAADAAELIRLTAQHGPDLVVTDIRMPPRHTDEGLVAALRIRRERPGTAIVVLSRHVQRRYATELLGERPYGLGYQLKQRIADIPTFCADLERVCAGGTALDPEVVALMMARARRDDALDRLTTRQREVNVGMAQGTGSSAAGPAPFSTPHPAPGGWRTRGGLRGLAELGVQAISPDAWPGPAVSAGRFANGSARTPGWRSAAWGPVPAGPRAAIAKPGRRSRWADGSTYPRCRGTTS
jgi:DNA-binding NarL/FixJ family response regulator